MQGRCVVLEPLIFDARPFQRRHQEPYGHIMKAVDSLQPGQSLLLLNTFEPRPLQTVLAARGFTYEAREVGPEDWEVLFSRQATMDQQAPPVLDHRGIDPAQASIRTLQTLRRVPDDRGLVAIFDQDPSGFLVELERRGYHSVVERSDRSVWRVAISRSGPGA